MFNGGFWTTGYHADGSDPNVVDNWSELAIATNLTEVWEVYPADQAIYPVFRFGRTSGGYLAGVFTLHMVS